jgi:hypothetical protein
MTFKSICNLVAPRSFTTLFIVLFMVQTVPAQIQTPAGGQPAASQQGRDSQTRQLAVTSGDSTPTSATPNAGSADPLLTLLLNKGLITSEDAQTILAAGNSDLQRDQLATLLKNKGLISATEFAALRAPAPLLKSDLAVAATGARVVSSSPVSRPKPPAPSVVAAVAPIRLLPIDVPQREGLIPDLKLGSGARIKPYGYFKTSVIRDSSSPQGNDFPLPLLAADTGPNGSPEFHLKARALRLGVNFEWLDPAPKTVITGRLEVDFEGDFTRVGNRNISSQRSSQPSIRLAWARIDRRFNDKVTGFVLFGQDWTPFASSTLPNMIENTNFGGIGYGAIYERAPQVRTGFNYVLGGKRSWKLQPEFAIVLPAFGDVPTNVADQLAFGERQGADSDRPGVQGRVVLQWQLDQAEGVAPAEFIVSFEHARRTAIVTSANVPVQFSSAFPAGAEVSSNSDAYSAEFQLPTRFATLVGKYYSGSDLRFFLGGQLLSNFNDAAGLTSTVSVPSIDGASTVVFGLANGTPAVAPQRPVRGQGGFVQLGIPLSRLANVNPKGRNAGWSAFLYYGFDEANQRDARRFAPVRGRSDLFSGNIQYKFNSWVTFAFEQGYYRTRAANRSQFDFGGLPLFRGVPSYTTHNVRSEFATIFTF